VFNIKELKPACRQAGTKEHKVLLKGTQRENIPENLEKKILRKIVPLPN
jgi:hypothetical protein